MPSNIRPVRALSDAQLDQFVQDGFVRLDDAFPRRLAEQGRAILWRDTGCDPLDRNTWTRPVVRLGYYGDAPFREAVNTPVLHAAFDQLVGSGRWRPRELTLTRHAEKSFRSFGSSDGPGKLRSTCHPVSPGSSAWGKRTGNEPRSARGRQRPLPTSWSKAA